MLTLVLTRHGLTDRSSPEQHLGQKIDISINDAGRRQADALRRRLAGITFDRVLTSPLFRARETAEIVAGRGVVIEADPRLREMDYGSWEGRTYAEIDATDRAFRGEWLQHPDALACPGGESGDDVSVRVTAFLGDLLDEHRRWVAKASFRAATATGGPAAPTRDHRVLAVAHGTLNRVFLCVALDSDVRRFRQRYIQSQCNLTVLAWADDAGPRQGTLLVSNDTSHLKGPRDLPWG
jgi:broad specificity phosphatase PhoE